MHDEQEFLQAIGDRPHDESNRLVFADWLEEAGDVRAEFLRVDARLAQLRAGDEEYAETLLQWRDLRDELPAAWQLLLSRSPVENCGLHLNPCPQKWSDLNSTAEEGVRHCWACDKPVHYCQSMDELYAHAERGHCVAVDFSVPHLPRDLLPTSDESVSSSLLGDLAFDSPAREAASRLWDAARRRSS